MNKALLFLILVIISSLGYTQNNETIFGIQYKPIVPNRFIGEYKRNFDNLPSFKSSTQQIYGHSFGMIVRHNFNEKLALETGINFTRRNFKLDFSVEDSGYFANEKLAFINYQIPINANVFIQLSDELFMNASGGINFGFYPSNVRIQTILDQNNSFVQEGRRTAWAHAGANANFGFEYRTRKKGYYYLGATYNLPFSPIMNFAMAWKHNNASTVVIDKINGSFLTVDFRYYFAVNKD